MLVGVSLMMPGEGVLDSSWVQGWLDESAGRLQELKGHQLAAVAQALTRVKARVDPVWMGRYLRVLQLKLREESKERMTAKQLVAVCGFLAEAGVQPGESFFGAVAACVRQQQLLVELQPHHLGLLAVAWKRLGWGVPRGLRGESLQAVAGRLQVVSADQLAQCLRLLAEAGWKVPASWAKRADKALAVKQAVVFRQAGGSSLAAAAAGATAGARLLAVETGAISVSTEGAAGVGSEAGPRGQAGLRLIKARRALKKLQMRRRHQVT
jgi:hypothetical protein